MASAFVIMPFKQPIGGYYQAIYKPALEAAGLQVNRGDDFFSPRPILDDIRTSVVSSDLLLADLTGRNPNVFYELGLAHAIGKPVILTTQHIDDIPFDLRHVRVIEYNLHDPNWSNLLRLAVEKAARSALLERSAWPLPLVQPSAVGELPPGLEKCLKSGSIDLYFREANADRNMRKEDAIRNATNGIRLLAKTGFSFFAPFGNRFLAPLEQALSRNVSLSVILYDRSRANTESASQKFDLSMTGLQSLKKRFKNLVNVRTASGSPVCTMLFVDNSLCFYEPYLEATSEDREKMLLNTFELLTDFHSSPHGAFHLYFNAEWEQALPALEG